MYLSQINNLGIKHKCVSRSITKMEKEIHRFIEQHNLDYTPDKVLKYQTIQRKLKRNPQIKWNVLNCDIEIEKLIAL